MPTGPGIHRSRTGKQVQIHAAGRDGDFSRVDAHRLQFENLIGAGGDDAVYRPPHRRFQEAALGRTRVIGALVPAFDRAKCVECLDHGHTEAGRITARRIERRNARHPEVAVDDVRRRAAPVPDHPVSERLHIRQQFVLRYVGGRTGVDMHHLEPRLHPHLCGQIRSVTPGVYRDEVAAPGQRGGQRGHVNILAARVHAAERCQRTGVFRNH
ncbi:MAG: hypothetical protein K0Q84_642 [Arthrobacter sp.]|nr:hypothetical protein [Arthrobacter sp.]